MKQGLIFIATLVLISCSTVLLTGRRQFTAIPSSQMLSLSSDSYKDVLQNSQLSSNQNYNQMVRSVGHKISAAVEDYFLQNGQSDRIKNFDWEYNVIQSNQLNAWCMPGGKIAFYEGIMPVCQDNNGVAVVMAHEVAHAVARHGNERMSQQLAIQLGGMALAGFDPRGSVDFWQRMQEKGGGNPPEFLSTHPHPDSRIRSLNQNMDKALEYYNSN